MDMIKKLQLSSIWPWVLEEGMKLGMLGWLIHN
jgi:hypothetical protein